MIKKEDLRIRKTKASLYKSLLQLMEEKTFEDIKITDICKLSLINRSTFYDHFNDKYELLMGLMADSKEEIKSHIKTEKDFSSIKDYYLETISLLLTYIEDNLNFYSVLAIIKKNNNSIAHDMLYDALLEEVTNSLKENCINTSNIPIETISIFYVSGVTNVLTEAIEDIKSFDRNKVLNELEQLIPNLEYLKKK